MARIAQFPPVLLAGALSAACVGPTFYRPAPPQVERFTAAPLSTANPGVQASDSAQRFLTQRDVPSNWWTLFGSGQLDELVDELASAGVPISPVLSRDEMLVHPQFVERGLLTTAPDGTRALAHPLRFAVHPARRPGLPPALGEHGDGGFSPLDGA